jgi:O-antigen/teichoic acid export membrane protein
MIIEILGPASGGHAAIALMIGSLLISPGVAWAGSAFAEGVNAPKLINPIQIKAGTPGLVMTAILALIGVLTAPWVLSLFGAGYAQEATGMLRLLALAAPIVVATRFYFSRLRVQKRMGRLIITNGILSITLLSISALMLPRIGLMAIGIGWLLAYCLVIFIVIGRAIKSYFGVGVLKI